MKNPALWLVVTTVVGALLSGCRRDTSDALPSSQALLSPKARDAGRSNCRLVDGGARVHCDDDPRGQLPRVHDCTWEWAEDPCPDAKPGVDQKPVRRAP